MKHICKTITEIKTLRTSNIKQIQNILKGLRCSISLSEQND